MLNWIIWNKSVLTSTVYYPVGWGCRIYRLHLSWEVRPHNESPGYDTKKSYCEVLVKLELWIMQSTPSLPYLPGPLWPGVVAPERALSMGQIELNCVLLLNWTVWNRTVFDIETLLMLNWNVWNRTVQTFILTWKPYTFAKLNCLK